ncbi:ATP phosphoribosyltransferase [Bacteroidetes bacterium endosymbiont of Geopemphigus sp.]|uniref:ATP phosphoribosyltransferase n=1 Tax=Bacteroidetes bacterium endosymbiont of Geopemphigus sp. TaxID=2047937 RepID=UPI000CCFFCD7|nr:ATP phosphoribosyltransferase [Bacteroidetes bacterium endosymbiont of Geopemphigus sp.]
MEHLRIALQKSGRLHEDSIRLLKDCGIDMNLSQRLKSSALNFPLEIFFLRDDDIPQYLEENIIDLGIVGENLILEKERKLKIKEKLGFGRCRLSIAVPKNSDYQTIEDLSEKCIATSYPNILKKFLDKQQIQADIHTISGAVEIAPGIGLSDAICDLVSSGGTLFINGLREIETILKSEALLVASQNIKFPRKSLAERLYFRIQAVKRARNNKYVMLNVSNKYLENILNFLSGEKSPTVLPLADPNWTAVHAVIEEKNLWNSIERLKAYGAQDLLVLPIKKMIP